MKSAGAGETLAGAANAAEARNFMEASAVG